MIDATTTSTSVDFRVGLRGPRVLWWAGCCAPHFEHKLPGFPYPHLLQTGGCFSCISAPDPGCRGSFQGGQRCGWHGLPANFPRDRNTGSRCALRVVRPARQRHGRYRSASWRPVTSNSAHRPSLSSLPESSIPALSTKPIPRWNVHFRGPEDDRKDSTGPRITLGTQMGGHRH